MASSGSFDTTGYQGRILTFAWSIQSQDITNNATTIAWSLRGAGDAQSSWYNAGNFRVVIDGTERYFSSTRIQLYNGTLVASGTVTLSHSADGTRSFSASAEAGIYYVAVNSSGSGSWSLDAIPRASQPSLSTSTVNYGSAVTIYTNRFSSAFTHTLRYDWNSNTGTIATGVSDSYTWTVPSSFMNYIPNSTSSSGKIICDTYNGSNLIGTKEINLATNVPSSVVPSFTTITNSELATAVNTIVGKYVQGLSKLSLAITGATGSYSSTISAYSITFDGKIYSNSSASTDFIKGSGSLTIVGTITDSRGRTASKTVNVTVLPYSNPSITAFSLSRCNSDGSANDIGTYVKVVSTGSVSSLINSTEKNSLTYKILSSPRNTGSWTTNKTSTLVNLSLNATDILGTYEAISSFDFRLEITDKFNTTLTLNVIPTGIVAMSWSKSGVGIGKVWEQGVLDVGGDIYSNGYKVWHSGNDGTGSGLDADLLDGKASGNASGNIPISNGIINTNLNADKLDGYDASAFLTSASFTQNLSSNGYVKLPNGLFLQWMTTNQTINSSGYTDFSVTFPITFTNACAGLWVGYYPTLYNWQNSVPNYYSTSNSAARVVHWAAANQPIKYYIFAVGY